ncbi:MAG: ATP-binding protein [Termitinemataceae bacterium]
MWINKHIGVIWIILISFLTIVVCPLSAQVQGNDAPLLPTDYTSLNSFVSKPVSLRNGWRFTFQDKESRSVSIPANWKFYGSDIPALGYARYERTIELPPSEQRQPLMLRIGEIGTACRVYINGTRVASQGVLSDKSDSHVPMVAPLYVPLSQNLPSTVTLTIEVSNFEDTNGGGIWGQILLGPEQTIRLQRDRNLIQDAAMTGLFLIVCLFYFVLYYNRIVDTALLLFACICGAFVFRQLVTGEKILLLMLPSLSWYALVRMEYLSLYVLAPLYIRFFTVLFGPLTGQQWFNRLLLFIGILSSCLVLVLPASWFIATLIPIQVYWLLLFIVTMRHLLRAVKDRQEDAWLFLISFIVFTLGALNDILLTRFYLPTLSMVSLAQAGFILVQSLALARHFAREYRRTKNLEDMNKHLSELEAARSRFYAAASHELRTPISLILTPLEAIMKGAYGEELSREAPVFSLIRRNCDRLKYLSEQLLTVFKMDSGMMKPVMQPVELRSFLSKYIQLFSGEAEKKRIRLEVVSTPSESVQGKTQSVYCWTDPVLLETVVLNLLSNAIKFTPEEGCIEIEITSPGVTNSVGGLHPGRYTRTDAHGPVPLTQAIGAMSVKQEVPQVVFSVRDSGPGIPESMQSKLFTRFSTSSVEPVRGLQSFGLGLPLSAEIVSLLGGTIEVASELGKGACFRVGLPLWKGLHPVSETATAYSKIPQQRTGTSILLVEDDEDMRIFLQDILSREWTVYSAQSGQEALDILRSVRGIHLIISDMVMYPMDGLQFREKVLELDGGSSVPFIFISAQEQSEQRLHAYAQGAVDFIIKPFHPDELIAKVHALCTLMQEKQQRMEQRLLRALSEDGPEGKPQVSFVSCKDFDLSERDQEVLEYVLTGLSDKEIAAALGCSPRTVSNRVSALLKRTGQPSRAALIAYFNTGSRYKY